MINDKIPQGTRVKFTADAHLRKISDKGVRAESGMGEGQFIGEQLEAIVTQQIAENAYIVVFPDGGHVGWVYNYELYVKDSNAQPEKLNFVKVSTK